MPGHRIAIPAAIVVALAALLLAAAGDHATSAPRAPTTVVVAAADPTSVRARPASVSCQRVGVDLRAIRRDLGAAVSAPTRARSDQLAGDYQLAGGDLADLASAGGVGDRLHEAFQGASNALLRSRRRGLPQAVRARAGRGLQAGVAVAERRCASGGRSE